MIRQWLQLAMLFSVTLQAETQVSGVLTRDTRWKPENSPYRLTGDLVVARHVRLTIAPGCRIIAGAAGPADTAIEQFDAIDSRYASLKVYGTLICAGNSQKRNVFSPDTTSRSLPAWYGIILDKADDQFTEISHTDITGAVNGITVRKCTPLIYRTTIEHNHIGILCTDHGSAHVSNSMIAHNTTAGIRIISSNPGIHNSIVVFNRNNGIWCDGSSKIDFRYNCIFGNGDGDLLDCDPEIGLMKKKNKNGDSVDTYHNLRQDPVFAGSPADSASREQDLSVPTTEERIRSREIAAIIHGTTKDTLPQSDPGTQMQRYELSEYSPCRNAGDPSSKLKDRDGTRNDMGIYGGPSVIDRK